MRQNIHFCRVCHNLSDADLCAVCASPRRDQALVCVVESIREAMAIEQTQHYQGTYHVLGGLIAPIDGIGPNDLNIQSLIQRIETGEIRELIMALSPTIEGETTIYYIAKQVKHLPVKISMIARGVAFGGELEYTDELTLSRSITARIPYQNE
jgi:recombination protein RecR